jgi:AcrR family transcriptional regulator
MSQNASAVAYADVDGVVQRATRRALRRHEEAYADEVRRLLDAGLEVMRRQGTTKSPRVADILEHAGLSRDAFYRHFASKEDLVAAVLEAGTWRLVAYAEHQMGKAEDPEAKLGAWVRAVMAQAMDADVAHTTRSVLWNGGRVPGLSEPGAFDSATVLSQLLLEPLGALPSPDPVRDAEILGHAVFGQMRAALQQGRVPDEAAVEHLTAFCLGAVRPRPTSPPGSRRRPR